MGAGQEGDSTISLSKSKSMGMLPDCSSTPIPHLVSIGTGCCSSTAECKGRPSDAYENNWKASTPSTCVSRTGAPIRLPCIVLATPLWTAKRWLTSVPTAASLPGDLSTTCTCERCTSPSSSSRMRLALLPATSPRSSSFFRPSTNQGPRVLRSLDTWTQSPSPKPNRSSTCQVVRVGLELQGVPEALASEECPDRAAAEPEALRAGPRIVGSRMYCRKHLADTARRAGRMPPLPPA